MNTLCEILSRVYHPEVQLDYQKFRDAQPSAETDVGAVVHNVVTSFSVA